MKKDDLIKGIGAVDDELIAEAAGREPKMKYKTKVRLFCFLTGAAAVAAMVATGFLLKASLGKPPKSDDKAAAIVTEDPGRVEAETATSPEEGTTANIITETARAGSGYEYATLAETTTKKGAATVTAAVTSTKNITMPETTVSTVTTDVPQTEERPFTFSNNEFFAPMKDFQWEGGIVNVQFGTAVLRDRGVWVNCSYEQADSILSMIHFLKPTDIVEDIGFDGGGFTVKTIYSDGSSCEYEFFGELGIYYFKDKDGTVKRLADTFGVEFDIVKYLQEEFIKIDPYITAFFEEKYGQ